MANEPYRVAILISGRGSNMRTILDGRDTMEASFVGVLASKPTAAGLEFAASVGINTASVASKSYGEREAFDRAVAAQLDAWGANFVVLAGFMRILSPWFLERYAGRIVNIHPSLLPSFPGLHPHQQALDAGVKLSGCTVHYVAPGAVDSGPVIAQAAVPVYGSDDADALASRVLVAEHALYPQTLRRLFAGALVLEGRRVMERG